MKISHIKWFNIMNTVVGCMGWILSFAFFLPCFQETEDHVPFLITVPTALAIFLAIFILACIEPLFKKFFQVFSLVVWVCLVAMGYLFMWFGGIICPWDQVSLFFSFCEWNPCWFWQEQINMWLMVWIEEKELTED